MRGARTRVLHATVAPRRRTAVALGGPLAVAALGLALVLGGVLATSPGRRDRRVPAGRARTGADGRRRGREGRMWALKAFVLGIAGSRHRRVRGRCGARRRGSGRRYDDRHRSRSTALRVRHARGGDHGDHLRPRHPRARPRRRRRESRRGAADSAPCRPWGGSRRLRTPMVWEIVFMLLILKIPLVYVCVVSGGRSSPSRRRPTDEVGVVADTPPPGGSPRRHRDGQRRPLRPHAPGLGGGSASPRSPARGRDGVRA